MGKSLIRFFKTFMGFVLLIGSTKILELVALKIWTLRNNICLKRSKKRSKNDPKNYRYKISVCESIEMKGYTFFLNVDIYRKCEIQYLNF